MDLGGWVFLMSEVPLYLAHTKVPPSQDRRRALGKVLLQGAWTRQFLMSEVPQ